MTPNERYETLYLVVRIKVVHRRPDKFIETARLKIEACGGRIGDRDIDALRSQSRGKLACTFRGLAESDERAATLTWPDIRRMGGRDLKQRERALREARARLDER